MIKSILPIVIIIVILSFVASAANHDYIETKHCECFRIQTQLPKDVRIEKCEVCGKPFSLMVE